MPALAPGMASLAGQVVGPDGQPIAGATVTVTDSAFGAQMASVTSGADGRWQLAVLANTTITLRADAMGYGRGLINSFSLVAGASSADLDMRLLPVATIDQLNAMGGTRVAEYGAIALRVQSLGGVCDPTGGTVSIDPAPLGRVFYAKADAPMPDQALTTVQSGAQPAAWILGVLPPGTYYTFKFAKPGCVQKTGAVEWAGRSYDDHLPVEAKALSYGILFVD
jgi:hypothetical protein